MESVNKGCNAGILCFTEVWLFIFQFDVIARDPSGKTGSAFVTVNVVRDQPPVFQSTPYRKNVIENEPIGTGVFTVTAIDPDIKVGITENANRSTHNNQSHMEELCI